MLLKWSDGCEKSFQHTYNYPGAPDWGGLGFFRLGRQEYLVKVACWSGAYQPGFLFMYYDERNPSSVRPLKLKGYESEDDDGKSLAYSLIDGLDTFHEKNKVLEIFSKYRGPGDCGRFVRYKFVGARPVVLEARERDCDERIRRPSDPRSWPRIKLRVSTFQ